MVTLGIFWINAHYKLNYKDLDFIILCSVVVDISLGGLFFLILEDFLKKVL